MKLLKISWRLLQIAIVAGLIGLLGFVLVCRYIVTRFDGTATLPADCAIVFGAAVRPVFNEGGSIVGSRAGPGITRRVQTAVDLYREKYIRTLFLSGGKGEDMKLSEAAVMRDYAVAQGVPPGDIVIEDQSRSTWENLVNTRPLVEGCASVIGISDRYHLARIEFLARQQGWELRTLPSVWTPGFAFEARSVVREALGILYYGILLL